MMKQRLGRTVVLLGSMLFLGSAVLVACTQPPSPPLQAPTVQSFTANPTTVEPGDASLLSWAVTGAGEVVISTLGGDEIATSTQASDSVEVMPAETTEYVLVASNSAGEATASVTVTVSGTETPEAPVITAFVADPVVILEGASSTLSWTFSGEGTLVISDGEGTELHTSELASGSFDVSPAETTAYQATVSNEAGEDEASVTVTVHPVAAEPLIVAFAADPDSIVVGSTSTLSWLVVGADEIEIFDGLALLHSSPDAAGSFDVSPALTTEYTLVATNASGEDDDSVTVTVTVPSVPTVELLSAATVLGSRVELTWSATDADTFEIHAVSNTDPELTILLMSDITSTTETVGIPPSTHQSVRVVATGAGGSAVSEDLPLTNVVVLATDYDPYDSMGWIPDEEVPGTLRYLVNTAAPGSVIGFASDVTIIDLFGVEMVEIGAGNVDAHLILRNDLTISGPVGGVTLEARSAWELGDPGDPFTYRSRVFLIPPGVEATLHNLDITGGTFIFVGAGIRNDGNLSVIDSVLRDNRAWNAGGGIWNRAGATLTIQGSELRGNLAATLNDEVDFVYIIRGTADPEGQAVLSDSGYGGGLFNEPGGTVQIIDSLLEQNGAKFSGGGGYNMGTLSLEDVDLVQNVASHEPYLPDPGYFSYGGGLYSEGTLTVLGGSFDQNTAYPTGEGQGGGLFFGPAGMASFDGTSFVGNAAEFGGGIRHRYYTGQQGNLSLSGVTDSGNLPQFILATEEGPVPPDGGLGGFRLDNMTDLPGRYRPAPGETLR